MKKSSQHSYVLDLLINNLPFADQAIKMSKDYIDPRSAKSLYSIWRDERNQVSNKIYKKPNTVSSSDIEDMKQQGLIRCIGDNVEITSKGSGIIQTMILGNDKSFFEKNSDIDYLHARRNINAKNKQEETWWERFIK